MLENEFAQLESVGIFISVSAGNSFTNYNTKGLSYPAASDYVIPVMATDGNGQLSYFSQRADGAIAAPGRYITSTVPDYAANDADALRRRRQHAHSPGDAVRRPDGHRSVGHLQPHDGDGRHVLRFGDGDQLQTAQPRSGDRRADARR
jgi:hypothetical protein